MPQNVPLSLIDTVRIFPLKKGFLGVPFHANAYSKLARLSVLTVPQLNKALKDQRLRQAIELYENEHDLVFTNEIGKVLDKSNVYSRVFQPALKCAGLRKVRFHDLSLVLSGFNLCRPEY